MKKLPGRVYERRYETKQDMVEEQMCPLQGVIYMPHHRVVGV